MRARSASLAILLVGCGAAQHPSTDESIALAYEVRLDAALGAMEVTVCPRASALPARLVPMHAEADGHVSATGIAGDCLRYEVDLTTCSAPSGPAGCARVSEDLLAPTSVWLLGPETRAQGARYALHFALPEGVTVTGIAEHATADPTRVVLDERNFAFVTYLAFVHEPSHAFEAPGSCIELATLDGPLDASLEARAHWLSVAVAASSRVTGEAPFDQLTALVLPVRDAHHPVVFGVAGRGMRPTVTLLVAEHAMEAQLVPDWTAVHELAHFLTAYVEGEDTWLAEGLATYYQEVLRARHGLVTEADAWAALTQGFARGRAASTTGTLRSASASMHTSHAYARVYWQGAALVLLADVAYRQAGSSLDAAVARAWPHRAERTSAAQLLAWLDGEPDGTFGALAARSLDVEAFPDVNGALVWLGVEAHADGTISLRDDAPGALARAALMNGGAPPASNRASCAAESR